MMLNIVVRYRRQTTNKINHIKYIKYIFALYFYKAKYFLLKKHIFVINCQNIFKPKNMFKKIFFREVSVFAILS